jgi:hypothetical protein
VAGGQPAAEQETPPPSGGSGTPAPNGAPQGTDRSSAEPVTGPEAERLLLGASVYREPADRNALLFQIGEHDWAAAPAPGQDGPAPPYRAPAGFAELIASCVASGALIVVPAGAVAVPEPLARRFRAAGGPELAAAHRRAAGYWQWRATAWPQGRRADLHDLLEARYHLVAAGEHEQAGAVTEVICAQLHVWGELESEHALITDTLRWLPERSARRAAWLHELGKIAQVRGDLDEAERLYQQALAMFSTAGDQHGVSRSYLSLSVIAQVQGDYEGAERLYERSGGSPPAMPASAEPAAAGTGHGQSRPDTGATVVSMAARRRAATSGPAIAQPHPAGPDPSSRPGVRVLSPAGDSPTDALPASAADPAGERPAPAGTGKAGMSPRWLWPAVGLAAAALMVVSATEIGRQVAGTAHQPRRDTRSVAVPDAGQAAATTRRQAAKWIVRQIAASAVISCDPAMCATLQATGVPAGRLLALGPSATDPLGSDVVVSTAALRSQFGTRLASVYAPVVLAAFGTGGSRIEVRVVAPDGSAAYLRALRADEVARRAAGMQLLRNRAISVSPAAARELAAGAVDARILSTLSALASLHQLRIAGFGGRAPGANPAVPLPEAEFTPLRQGRPQAAAVQSLRPVLAFVRAQRTPYRASVARIVRGPGGQAAVLIEFAEPSPLGLLSAAAG